ncbi:MAG: hypothetical protein ACE5HQ_08710 [Gemmatimonadota bacterium]
MPNPRFSPTGKKPEIEINRPPETRDGGETRTNVASHVRGLPPFSWIAKIEASHHAVGTAYVAVDDHILEPGGDTVREWKVKGEGGVNRVAWDLRYEGPDPVSGGRSPEVGSGFGSGSRGPLAVPGEYAVSLRAGERELRGTVHVEADPRVNIPLEDYRVQLRTGLALRDLLSRANGVLSRVRALQSLMRSVTAIASRPTEAELDRLEELRAETGKAEADLDGILATSVRQLNERLESVPRILVKPGGS